LMQLDPGGVDWRHSRCQAPVPAILRLYKLAQEQTSVRRQVERLWMQRIHYNLTCYESGGQVACDVLTAVALWGDFVEAHDTWARPVRLKANKERAQSTRRSSDSRHQSRSHNTSGRHGKVATKDLRCHKPLWCRIRAIPARRKTRRNVYQIDR